MASVDNARIRPRGLAAIAAVAVFMALAVTGSLPVGVAVPPTADPAEASTKAGTTASAQGHMMALHKGGSDDVGIRGRGFVADNSVFTTIDAPGARSFTVAFGIDNRGRTVGGYADDRGTLHGFLRDKEAFTVIDFPGAVATLASKINAQGQIVGAYSENRNIPAFQLPHGFLLDKGVFTKIDVPGAVRTQPFSINNLGQIVGEYRDAAGALHSFLRDSKGAFTTINVPGAAVTSISGINDRGQMIGVYGDTDGKPHGFLLDQVVVTTIDVPGATVTIPFGINNRGEIVGGFIDAGGIQHGFLAECDDKKRSRRGIESSSAGERTCAGNGQAK